MSPKTPCITTGISPPPTGTLSAPRLPTAYRTWSSHRGDPNVFEAGHGTAPDLIYARGVSDAPSPDPTSFDKKQCILIIVEIGFCRDVDCDSKIEKNNEKYSSLLAALRRYWGRVEFVVFPIGHAGTTLTRTLDQLTAAFSAVRPTVERSRASRCATNPATDYNAKTHDYNRLKPLLNSLTDQA